MSQKLKIFVVDFGPQNISVDGRSDTSYKITWDQAPSCYKIQGFQFAFSKGK